MTALANPTVTIENVNLLVQSVDQVVVSAIVDDGTGQGIWIRQISIFADPAGAIGSPVLVINIKSPIQGNLDITTPQLTF